MLIDAPKEVELTPSERCFYVAKELLAVVSEIDDIYAELSETITTCEQKTQDLLHEIEFSNFNASEGCGLAKKIKAIRHERREAKNQRESIAHFKQFADNHKNMPVTLAKLLASMKQTKQIQEKRVYVPRCPDGEED
jgi:hypothetical protein